jgi:hypothetical protein
MWQFDLSWCRCINQQWNLLIRRSTAEELFRAYQKLQDAMDIQPFHNYECILGVDAVILPDGEQRVTVKGRESGRYGGSMILRQGVLPNIVWVYWAPDTDIRRTQSSIPYDKVLWDIFFDVAEHATELRPGTTLAASKKKKKIFGRISRAAIWFQKT